MTIQNLAAQYRHELKTCYEVEEVSAIFREVLWHILGWNYSKYLSCQQEEVPQDAMPAFEKMLKQLKENVPLQYILGEMEFYGLRFQVDSSVLIPRPETEELVQLILGRVADKNSSLRILDIGTGSGCIAIALKKNLPDATVYATDIAIDSLQIAQQNAILNEVEIHLIRHDILVEEQLDGLDFDLIVSNPPYIKEDEKATMHANVLTHEPHRALFVTNQEPLIFYHAISEFACRNLKKNGLLFFEINEHLGQETLSMIQDQGFSNCMLFQDMQGKDRMIQCEMR